MSISTTTPVSSVLYNGTAIPLVRHTASIVATSTTGSIVTMTTPGGRTVTGVETSGTWTFSGLWEIGVYSLTASLSGRSRTETVYVDSDTAYLVELNYKTYLYKEGDQCTSITGGWRSYAYGIVSGYSALTPSFASNSILLTATVGATSCAVDTINAISVTNYSKLCADCISNLSAPWMRFCMRTTNTGNYENSFIACLGDGSISGTSRVTIELPFSDVTSNVYVLFGVHMPNTTITIYNMWLE